MAGKREKPEDIVLKLRQVEVYKGKESQFPRLFDKLASPFRQRWSREFGPVVKVDRMKKVMIQNDKKKEPCARFQSQGCA